jgi:hypothetical protein
MPLLGSYFDSDVLNNDLTLLAVWDIFEEVIRGNAYQL